ncbi:MAG: SET domain-containing protein [Saprospiraceae bacterium]
MQRIPGIYFAYSDIGGRGVFTSTDIPEGSLIEICPVIVIPKAELPIIHKTVLHDYYFLWGYKQDHCAIALGYGSLYNHQVNSNAHYDLNIAEKTIEIIAVRNIKAGEEICVNYNGEPGDGKSLWFDKDEEE